MCIDVLDTLDVLDTSIDVLDTLEVLRDRQSVRGVRKSFVFRHIGVIFGRPGFCKGRNRLKKLPKFFPLSIFPEILIDILSENNIRLKYFLLLVQ